MGKLILKFYQITKITIAGIGYLKYSNKEYKIKRGWTLLFHKQISQTKRTAFAVLNYFQHIKSDNPPYKA